MGEANFEGADAAGNQRPLGGGNHSGGGRSRGRDGAERRGGHHRRSHGSGLLEKSTKGATARVWSSAQILEKGGEKNKAMSEMRAVAFSRFFFKPKSVAAASRGRKQK